MMFPSLVTYKSKRYLSPFAAKSKERTTYLPRQRRIKQPLHACTRHCFTSYILSLQRKGSSPKVEETQSDPKRRSGNKKAIAQVKVTTPKKRKRQSEVVGCVDPLRTLLNKTSAEDTRLFTESSSGLLKQLKNSEKQTHEVKLCG